MKRFTYMAAVTTATMVMTAVAMAGSVDIGLGRMDQAEFDTLRQMVSGDYRPSDSATTVKPQAIRVAEFDQSVVDDIRQTMAAGTVEKEATESLAGNGMVDIGTGAMATSEFCDLNKLVASNTMPNRGFTFICP